MYRCGECSSRYHIIFNYLDCNKFLPPHIGLYSFCRMSYQLYKVRFLEKILLVDTLCCPVFLPDIQTAHSIYLVRNIDRFYLARSSRTVKMKAEVHITRDFSIKYRRSIDEKNWGNIIINFVSERYWKKKNEEFLLSNYDL